MSASELTLRSTVGRAAEVPRKRRLRDMVSDKLNAKTSDFRIQN
jgi:hypothetical protein